MAMIARMPANVMTIETTKASRGRSMKMSEIMSASGRRQLGFLHHLAGPDFLDAVDDDVLALAQARGDDDVGILVISGLDAALLDLVLVVDHQEVRAGLVDLHRGLRHH